MLYTKLGTGFSFVAQLVFIHLIQLLHYQTTMDHYYVGIDVGTGSVRAGLVDEAGHVVKVAVHDIDRVSPAGGQYVQSSQNIWSAVCHTVKEVLEGSNVAAEKVRGIGFDATCSLVVVGTDDEVVTVVDDPGDGRGNVFDDPCDGRGNVFEVPGDGDTPAW